MTDLTGIPLVDRTIPRALASSQARGLERPFLVSPETTLTHADVEDRVARIAGALAANGVQRGTRIALLHERAPRYVLLLLALARLGAPCVALNTDAKGRTLTYFLEDSECALALVDAVHEATFSEAAPAGLEHRALADGEDWVERLGAGRPVAESEDVAFDDVFVVLYTSGTTGMPKGVPVTHAHAVSIGAIWSRHQGFTADDRLHTALPFFHINGTAYSLAGALVSGASLAIGSRFSARGYWADLRDLGATQANAMGSMVKILESRDPHPGERDHAVKSMFLAPLPAEAAVLAERFGLAFSTTYAQTEWLPSSLTSPGEGYDRAPGGTGLVLPSNEVAILGEHDEPLPPGSRGEIGLRAHEPYTVFTGYLGKPKESLEAFRNLRFHTGDLGMVSEDGWLHFLGRTKDVIRRRGENISAYLVEELLSGHPDVAEVAAVPVPSTLLEEEVFTYVVLREGAELSPDAFVAFGRDVMPRHMVPLYVQFVDDLPRTATNKVAKAALTGRAAAAVRDGDVAALTA